MNYFDDPSGKHFSFESFADGCDETTFGVINFKGYEAISKPYDFEIMLVSSKKDLELEDLLQAQAVFTIHRGGDDDVLYNGILAEFDQLHEVNDVIFYRARLVPKLWWLTLTHHNQVFLDQSIPAIVEDALRDGGLETADLDIGALSGYEENSYICQYDESHFNFVSRCLERQGIYYYFVQEDDGEVLTLTDTKFSHAALKEGSELFYNPASGLEGKHLGEAIGSFTCRQKQLPAEIILKDYNYERPSLDITSRADVDPGGRGVSYIYGEYFATAEEGERLAGIRAEELLCKKREFFGESTVPYIMPGFTFNLNNHYREDFNQEYLILEVTHEGNQSHLMSGGITTDSGKSLNQGIYHNSFKAIPNETQYRPDRITEKPKISGTIHAKIDSEVDGEYAQIDEQGRYRVKLPFDINDEHMDGKGSAPIRMMQPYAGKNRGMQFPLVKGTEVLLTFIEGNPDRPMIAGAVSNPETQGPVNAENLSESVIQTGGNNRIRMEDKEGSERMVFESPIANSWIRVGAPNDPITLNGAAVVRLKKGDPYTDLGAVITGTATAVDPAVRKLGEITDMTGTPEAIATEISANEGVYTFTYKSLKANSSLYDTAIRKVYVYDSTTTNDFINIDTEDQEGIRIRTAGVYWNEGMSRVGDYIGGYPAATDAPQSGSGDPTHTDPEQIGNIIYKFGPKDEATGYTGSYNPTGLLSYYKDKDSGEPVPLTIKQAMAGGQVTLSSMDTINTQEGNIYDFGGYWNYNLGNSYAEEHIRQDAKLNAEHSVSFPKGGMSYYDPMAILSMIPGAFAAIAIPIAAGIATGKGSPPSVTAAGITAGAMTVCGFVISSASMLIHRIVSGNHDLSDLVTSPGGNSGIKTWADRVKASEIDDDGALSQLTSNMTPGTTWVSKTYGDAYSFNQGNSIEISHGNSEEHSTGDSHEFVYGGIHEETKFNGKGIMTSWSESGGGQSKELTFNPLDGSFTKFEYKNTNAMLFSFEAAVASMPKLDVSIAMSSMHTSLGLSAGMKIDVEAALGLAVSMKYAAGFAIEIESNAATKAEFDFETKKFVFKGPGTTFNKEAAMDAKIQDLMLDDVKSYFATKKVDLTKIDVSANDYGIAVVKGQWFGGI